MSKLARVVIGLLGVQKDRGESKGSRWESWRPTVAMCQHEDLLIRRIELLGAASAPWLADQIKEDIRTVSPETIVNVHPVDFENPWDFPSVYAGLFEFARSYPWKPDEEEYLVHITTGTHVVQICLFLLTESRHIPGKLIQTSPRWDKKEMDGIGSYDIIDLDLSKFDLLASRFAAEKRDAVKILKSGIATRNERFNKKVDEIERVAVASKAPMLFLGPTGAGKSQLAKRIFELKKARHLLKGDFVEVNCATIRGDGAMSALFGHKRGAFTGALESRAGLLRAADRGVLFLDEIGELGPDEQAMLLRALEEKRFLPVGADREAESDFQLIAGTNRDLVNDVAAGRFRDDLLARINLWTFELPGLVDRKEDIEPNIAYELEAFERSNGRRVSFSKEALKAYLSFATGDDAHWIGNFRDLNASIVRMSTLAPAGRITEAVVADEIEKLRRLWRAASRDREDRPTARDAEDDLRDLLGDAAFDALDRFDRVQLADVVRVARSSKTISDAGRKLFAVSRTKKKSANDADRLKKYLAGFGLTFDRLRES